MDRTRARPRRAGREDPPAPPPRAGLRPLHLAAAVFATALLLYSATVARTVTAEDSGELITAASRWGVAHPPGYPLYCLLVRPFLLLPFESIALRVNLASAVFGALAAAGVALVALEMGAPRFAAACGGLSAAVARSFWAQAVVAEVYTLSALLLIATIGCLVRWARLRDARWLIGAWVIFAASLANHYPLMLLAAPSLLVFVLREDRRVLAARRAAWALAGGALLVAAIYAYLPLAARSSPPLNWGDPSTWDRFVAHVSRAAYRGVEHGRTATLDDKLGFAGLFVRLLAGQWTPPVLLLVALGVFRLRDRPRLRDLLLGVAAVTVAGLVLIPSYAYEHENVQRMDELYLPVYVVLAPVLAEGGRALVEIGERASAEIGGAARVLAAAAVAVPAASGYAGNDLSEHRSADVYNRFLLESLEPGAVLYTSGDYTSFPTLYLQAVEGVRPDVILASVTGELSPAAQAYARSIDPALPVAGAAAVQAAFVERGPRPVYVASRGDILAPVGADVSGLVYRLRPSAAPARRAGPDLVGQPLFPDGPRAPAADDLAASITADYKLMLGEAHFARGEVRLAAQRYREAAAAGGASKETVNNVASTCAERGLHVEAEELMRRAAAMSPGYLTPRRNLARLLDSLGRRAEAIAAYEAVLALAPEDRACQARLAQLRGIPSVLPGQPPPVPRFPGAGRAPWPAGGVR